MLCAPDKAQSLLSRWLQSLEEYTRKLQSAARLPNEVPSLLTPPPPFSPLSHNVHTSAIYLTTLCAELAIYSSQGSADSAKVNPSISSPERTNCGTVLPGTQPCDSLEDFIGRYAEMLDLTRMRCLLAHQDWEVRKKAWWALNRVKSECNNQA